MTLFFIASFLNGLLIVGVLGALLNFGIALHYFRKTYIKYDVKIWSIFKSSTCFFIFIVLVGVARLMIG